MSFESGQKPEFIENLKTTGFSPTHSQVKESLRKAAVGRNEFSERNEYHRLH